MTAFPPQPAIDPAGHWEFPTPVTSRLDNGLEVIVYQLPGQHVIASHLILDTPLNAEARELEGVATITARTLDEGTLLHGGDEFAELLETEGAGLGVDVSLAGLQAVLDVPVTRLDRALELFAEAVIQPAFADEDVNRHVQLRLAQIEQAQANSAQAATIAFRRTIFDAESRASRMNAGEPETVAQVTPEAVRSFHRDHFGPVGAKLVMAGDFADDPAALAERVFGGWQNPGQRIDPIQPAAAADRRRLIIDRPGAVQADIRLGGFGIDRADPRWADISVASYAMGGAFLSRLNAVLREEKGYTYGVRMSFAPMTVGGSFAVQGSFRTDVVGDALAQARSLLSVAGSPFTQQEVDDAVAYVVGVSPLRYATADGVADQAATQILADLGQDYVTRNLEELRAVTPESATRAYESLVNPDDLSLVIVGDAASLADPVRKAGFEDVEIERAG
ncbi:MAG: zinc protease [Propionibacteriaceae bacterium]|jgi:predicted Zn-dependent peptidase|nr:zinc protease [Propionibacteriaceae bacterium]